jgi:hypothetical protein
MDAARAGAFPLVLANPRAASSSAPARIRLAVRVFMGFCSFGVPETIAPIFPQLPFPGEPVWYIDIIIHLNRNAVNMPAVQVNNGSDQPLIADLEGTDEGHMPVRIYQPDHAVPLVQGGALRQLLL